MIEERDMACQTTLPYQDSIEPQQTPSPIKPSLKQEILELAAALDSVVDKSRQQPPISVHDKVLKEQMTLIQKLRQTIKMNQMRIANNIDDQKSTDLVEQLHQLQSHENTLKLEFNSIKKIQQQQQLALSNGGQSEHLNKQKEQLIYGIKSEKSKGKYLNEQINIMEQQLKHKHEAHYKQNEKLKLMDSRIQGYKRRNKQQQLSVSQDDITIIENQLAEIVDEIDYKQQQYKLNIQQLERERKKVAMEVSYQEKVMRDKEKELKLTQLRFNEQLRIYRKQHPQIRLENYCIQEIMHRPQNTPQS